MELDQNLLKEIGNMDDDALKSAIEKVCTGMGYDPRMAAGYLSDMGKIKKTVMSLTQEDLNRVEAALGEDTTKSLVESLRKETKGN